MKIVYCIYDYTAGGGTERIIARKCNALVNAGYDVVVVSTCSVTRKSVFAFSDKIKQINLNLDYEKARGYNLILKILIYPWLMFRHRRSFRRAIQSLSPDVIISTFGNDAPIVANLKTSAFKVLEFHHNKGYKLIELENRKISKIQKYFIQKREIKDQNLITKFDKFVVLTHEDRASWGNPPHCAVIPNINSFEVDATADLTSKQVLAMGRLTYQKGFDLLIDAWKLVVAQIPDWHLNISGEGGEKENLLAKIKANGLENYISLLPFTNDVVKRYMEHSIFVLSSRHEGFGLALTEAMECGIPCVSFRCKSGPSEIISHNEDGFLVDAGNLNDMAQRIISLCSNQQMRFSMGRLAKQNVRRYDEDKVMQLWLNLFGSFGTMK